MQEVATMDEIALREFLTLRIPEGLYIDYKERLSGKNEKEGKREFLKDVTAFANAYGGNLLIGVKEPDEGLPIDDQLVGIAEGVALAKRLERVASSSIDPRISGLNVRDIELNDGSSCVVIHIPASLDRPHMVQHQGHRGFYIRHSESCNPMSIHEIRESVIASMSAEAKAKQYLAMREQDVLTYFKRANEPLFLLQAVPLVSLTNRWDMADKYVLDSVKGVNRSKKYHWYAELRTSYDPKPTIDGLVGKGGEDTWEIEVHKNGYVSVVYRNKLDNNLGGREGYFLHAGYCHLFRAFCDLLDELLAVTNTDLPYIVSCEYLGTEGTVFVRETFWTRERFSEPYQKTSILWPTHIKGAGQKASGIAEDLCLEMFNAFGYSDITE